MTQEMSEEMKVLYLRLDARMTELTQGLATKVELEGLAAKVEGLEARLDAKFEKFEKDLSAMEKKRERFERQISDDVSALKRQVKSIQAFPSMPEIPRQRHYATEYQSVDKPIRRRLGIYG
jgi:hypothetical protein